MGVTRTDMVKVVAPLNERAERAARTKLRRELAGALIPPEPKRMPGRPSNVKRAAEANAERDHNAELLARAEREFFLELHHREASESGE